MSKRRKVEIVVKEEKTSPPLCGNPLYQVFKVTEAKDLNPKVFAQEVEHVQSDILQLICDYGANDESFTLTHLSEEDLHQEVLFRVHMHNITSQATSLVKKMVPSENRMILLCWLQGWFLNSFVHTPVYDHYSANPNISDTHVASLFRFLEHIKKLNVFMPRYYKLTMNIDNNVMNHFIRGTFPTNLHFVVRASDTPNTKQYHCTSLQDFAKQLQQYQLQWFEKSMGQTWLTLVDQLLDWKDLFFESSQMHTSEKIIYVDYDFRTLVDKVQHILSSNSVRLPRSQLNMRTVKVPCSGDYSAILSHVAVYFKECPEILDYSWLKDFRKTMRNKHNNSTYKAKVKVPRCILQALKQPSLIDGGRAWYNSKAVYSLLKILPFK